MATTKYKGTITADAADVRDHTYRPTLRVLPAQYLCDAVTLANAEKHPIRNQGTRPSCIGESLAALVDIQRVQACGTGDDAALARAAIRPASAAMLYAMAIEAESQKIGRSSKDVYSLRSGLKGFYNTGVCAEDTWTRFKKSDGKPEDDFDSVSVEIMREARTTTLGAYFRVLSYITDYHAALVEAGALYVSAELHGGWTEPLKGVIDPKANGPAPADGHAFVIVGYDCTGFLVLNSWGKKWGGYEFAGGPALPGVALWTYADWAASVTDAWVLRLAAATPDSFRYFIGQHGAAQYGPIASSLAAPGVRRLEVLGHYLHLDDGKHVVSGAYPSSRKSLETTLALLGSDEKDTITDIRLTIHGDTMPTAKVMARIAAAIPTERAEGVHNIGMLWVNDLLSGAAEALKPLFDAALLVAGGNRDDADHRIEKVTRPVGRALWRDVRRSVAVASRKSGDATHALNALLGLCAAKGKRLHILTEGAGVLLLAALIGTRGDHPAADKALITALASLTMVAPLITEPEFNDTIGPFLEVWHQPPDRQAIIVRPDANLDERLCVGAYSRSWTDLVARAFEETPVTLVGAHDFEGKLLGKPTSVGLSAPDRPSGDLSAEAILQHDKVRRLAEAAIRHARKKLDLPTI